MENFTPILEAILFASGTPRRRSEILENLQEKVTATEMERSINELKEKYGEDSGVVLVTFNDKIQLTTNPIFGVTVAEVLTPLREKELSKVLLEVLAIIAYKQPITRLEIENVKNSSAEYALTILLKANLVEVVGRKEAVGRPVLYGTTEDFLRKFQLTNLEELPDFNAVLVHLESKGEYYKSQVGLYRDIELPDDAIVSDQARQAEIEKLMDNKAYVEELLEEDDELPEFLRGEEFEVVE